MAENKAPLVLVANVIIRGKLECVTGTHIGGSAEKLEIGGLDSPVVRDPISGKPYIPGSSIKGKLRHLLEYITGGLNEPYQGEPGNVSMARDIVRLFGIGAEVKELSHDKESYNEAMEKAKEQNKKEYLERVKKLKNIGITRLIVRDAMPDAETVKLWEDELGEENYTELKAENFVDRLTSAANPRFIERVVAGSKFEIEFVYSVYRSFDQSDEAAIAEAGEDLGNLKLALRLLENNFIGKSGTRGYGKVRFHLLDPIWLKKKDYLEGGENYEKATAALPAALKPLSQIAFAHT